MFSAVQRLSLRVITVLVLTVSLAGAGLAHRTTGPMDAELQAFLAVGGTFADICDDQGSLPHAGAADCEACRLINGAHVDPGVTRLLNPMIFAGVVDGPQGSRIAGSRAWHSPHAARAPPVA